jgi:hypothetical protein
MILFIVRLACSDRGRSKHCINGTAIQHSRPLSVLFAGYLLYGPFVTSIQTVGQILRASARLWRPSDAGGWRCIMSEWGSARLSFLCPFYGLANLYDLEH